MQYRLNREVLKNFNEEAENKVEIKNEPTKLAIIFMSALLLSRVAIMIGEGDISGVAPFGIAFLISVIASREQGKIIIASIGALVGYFTINTTLKDGWMYLVTVLMVLGYSIVINKFHNRFN